MVKSNAVSITVAKAPPVLSSISVTVSPLSGDTNTPFVATATAKDQYGMAAANKTLYLLVDGLSSLSKVTDVNGVATFTFSLSASGTYSISVADNASGT